ncbi:serine hydrolase domain-containing protein [Clostridium sp.]|uniref:serine hydrolase domain-containing protein n=1 Tax=Clostridium sp. TaxID=1506 RepID=UPI0034649756
MNSVLAAKINDFMELYCNTWAFSGSILVVQKGETIIKKGYGQASIEHNIPNTPKTKFRICSITKQFTAMAVMMLQENGLLSVNDNIYKFFPECQQLDKRITIHHLLTHTSGLQYLFGQNFPIMYSKSKHTHEDMFNVFKDKHLLCDPGEMWNYSNYGYYLLGCIVEKVSGVTYDEFLKKNIFEPLNMKNTGIEKNKAIVPGLANGYYLNDNDLMHTDYVNMDTTFGSGEIYSTVEDMLIWDQALYNGGLVSEETLDTIFSPYANSGERGTEDNDYGYGWFIDKMYGRKRISHDGGGLGFITGFDRYINEQVSIIVLSNYGFTAVWRIANILAAIVFQEEYQFPSRPLKYDLDYQVYEKYMGVYKCDYEKLTVGRDKEKMFFVIDDEYIIPMYPISETEFHHTWIDESYTFSKDENGDLYFWGAKKQ